MENIENQNDFALLDTKQLAARLGVSKKHIQRLRIRHQIPWIKLGRTVRFDPAHVATAIRNNLTVRAAKKPAAKSMLKPEEVGE
ncbi:MAG TPA: helix-turn-helix domain-containing protein [Chthoniobacterales bacterium]